MLSKFSKWLIYAASYSPAYIILAIRLLLSPQEEAESLLQKISLNYTLNMPAIITLSVLFLLSVPVLQNMLNSPLCYQQSQKYTHGVGNQDLGLTRMINIIFPICSIEEQKQIVANLESRLSVCDSIEQTVDAALQQAEAMRQSILKDAFEGKL